MARKARATITLGTLGGPELRRDLEAIKIGTGREVIQIRRDAAQMIAPVVRRFATVGPGPRKGKSSKGGRDERGRFRADRSSSSQDDLPHFRDTIAPRLDTVRASHPAAGLLEFGGTIAPRGYRIKFRPQRPGWRAVVREADRVEQLAARRIDALILRVTRG